MKSWPKSWQSMTLWSKRADQVTATIEALDNIDKMLHEEIAVIVAKIEANKKKRAKAVSRRRQLRRMANDLEEEREKESE